MIEGAVANAKDDAGPKAKVYRAAVAVETLHDAGLRPKGRGIR